MSAKNFFNKYVNEYFVETGSYIGDGIQQALDTGFKNIISIELSDKYFDTCKERFKENKNVTIVKGDSAHILFDVIKDINVPITFWLDGHHSCGDTACGEFWVPLIQELEQIKKHKINTHLLMIDDMRCWENFNPVHGFSKKDIVEKAKEINNNYQLSYEEGVEVDDVLICKI